MVDRVVPIKASVRGRRTTFPKLFEKLHGDKTWSRAKSALDKSIRFWKAKRTVAVAKSRPQQRKNKQRLRVRKSSVR